MPRKAKSVKPIAVNWADRKLLCEDGEILPIVTFLDEEGDECEEEDGICFVAGTPDFGFVTCLMREYNLGYIH